MNSRRYFLRRVSFSELFLNYQTKYRICCFLDSILYDGNSIIHVKVRVQNSVNGINTSLYFMAQNEHHHQTVVSNFSGKITSSSPKKLQSDAKSSLQFNLSPIHSLAHHTKSQHASPNKGEVHYKHNVVH